MMSPLVSIIVPVYNVEQYLRQCLDSICQQTYRNLEIILVNDGSSDKSGDICEEYSKHDSRIIVVNKSNGGLSSARNAGLLIAKGEFLLFVDSDDWIVNDMVSSCLAVMEDSKIDFCFFNADCFDETGYERKQNYHRKRSYDPAEGLVVLTQLCDQKEFHSSVNLLFFKRDFLKKYELSFFPGILFEDMLFTFQAYALAFKILYLDLNLYQRRYRSDSIMTSKASPLKFHSAIKVYEQLLLFAQKRNLLEKQVSLDYITRCAFNIFNLFSNLSTSDRKTCKSQMDIVRDDILRHRAFGNTALRMRCYGVIPWLLFKLYEKSLGSLLSR